MKRTNEIRGAAFAAEISFVLKPFAFWQEPDADNTDVGSISIFLSPVGVANLLT